MAIIKTVKTLEDYEREAIVKAAQEPYCLYPSHIVVWERGGISKLGRLVTAPKPLRRRRKSNNVLASDHPSLPFPGGS